MLHMSKLAVKDSTIVYCFKLASIKFREKSNLIIRHSTCCNQKEKKKEKKQSKVKRCTGADHWLRVI